MRRSTSISAGAALVAALTLVSCACSAPNEPASQPSPPVAVQPPPSTAPSNDTLQASFEEMAKTLPAGDVGIAVSGGAQPRTFGSWSTGTAWSTIKVPLAIAALRKDSHLDQRLIVRAIANSDNDAAEQMWATLGAPTEAAQAVQAVLAQGGDTTTTVQSQRVRPPYTAFGQTDWPQAQQARFAFALPCLDSASTAPVIDQMHRLDAEQLWGLAALDSAAAKGGWGPQPDGGYLVRQLAVVTNESGTSGVALAAKPVDGKFATGIAILDKLGAWVFNHRGELPAGHC